MKNPLEILAECTGSLPKCSGLLTPALLAVLGGCRCDSDAVAVIDRESEEVVRMSLLNSSQTLSGDSDTLSNALQYIPEGDIALYSFLSSLPGPLQVVAVDDAKDYEVNFKAAPERLILSTNMWCSEVIPGLNEACDGWVFDPIRCNGTDVPDTGSSDTGLGGNTSMDNTIDCGPQYVTY